MDQNSKENLPDREFQISPEDQESPPVESEPPPEAAADQPPVEFQPAPPEYSEAEIGEQAAEITRLPESDKLTQLKSVALKDGVVKAVRIAKKMGDPRLLDELHDAIQDEPELKTRLEAQGKIEKL